MTHPTLSILALLAIAAIAAAPGVASPLAMSAAAIGVCVIACRWISEDHETRRYKLKMDEIETVSLREHNVRKATDKEEASNG